MQVYSTLRHHRSIYCCIISRYPRLPSISFSTLSHLISSWNSLSQVSAAPGFPMTSIPPSCLPPSARSPDSHSPVSSPPAHLGAPSPHRTLKSGKTTPSPSSSSPSLPKKPNPVCKHTSPAPRSPAPRNPRASTQTRISTRWG